jgi:hypothetical protein
VQIIEVTDLAVRSSVIRLRRPGSKLQFVLYPMLHMAKPSFYAAVTRRLAAADVVVVEGVGHGRSSVLLQALTSSYRVMRFNRRADVVEQRIDYAALGVPVIRPDVSREEFAAGWKRIPLRDRLLLWSVLPAVLLVRLFGGTRQIWSHSLELNDLPLTSKDEVQQELSPELQAALSGERDERLLEALCRLHEERGDENIEVAVVYGAAHTTPVVLGLMRRYGYRPRSADWLTIVDL